MFLSTPILVHPLYNNNNKNNNCVQIKYFLTANKHHKVQGIFCLFYLQHTRGLVISIPENYQNKINFINLKLFKSISNRYVKFLLFL